MSRPESDNENDKMHFMVGWWINAPYPTAEEPLDMKKMKREAEHDWSAFLADCLNTKRDGEGYLLDDEDKRIDMS